jgi:aerobic-type carbon monoxide dehydrogenase small subunit (CoxS/CutS family)
MGTGDIVATSTISFTLNGSAVDAPIGGSLLDTLREHLGVTSAKDGCSPQGQCGCCTVWVDGQPRVACVTPVGRVAGRAVTTLEGLDGADRWADAFCANGGSQCGFCTPGIIMRVAALTEPRDAAVRQALLAHLCRCTGWHPIVTSVLSASEGASLPTRQTVPGVTTVLSAPVGPALPTRQTERRAALEGGTAQSVGAHVALGRGGFADDSAPAGALVALLDGDGHWVVGESLAEARRLSGKIQGRRTTAPLRPPIDVPAGAWMRTLQTAWVEPAYLEPDAAWCEPGGEPASSLGNGGAFGGKATSEVGDVARRLADEHGRPVRALYTREDVVRRGPKRPPIAAGIRADGTGLIRVVRTPGITAAIGSIAPGLAVEEVDVVGPPTTSAARAAGWAEAAVLLASIVDTTTDTTTIDTTIDTVTAPNGATASASIAPDGSLHVRVRCGDPLDEVVLRSYCTGAAHMALGWVRSEGVAIGDDGTPLDLTIRSFGVLRAVDTPPLDIEIEADDGEPVNGSDAVLAAVAAAAWRHTGFAPVWPVTR